jgi:diadenosine tetraphosphatase ApaH/serine/threonine PP2A family protein phosphatase
MAIPEGTRHLINPGSVGQPRDCDWRAAFVVYDSERREIVYHRVPYDLTGAQGRILMAGLPERLAARLREGR